jgi:hypothetical protein
MAGTSLDSQLDAACLDLSSPGLPVGVPVEDDVVECLADGGHHLHLKIVPCSPLRARRHQLARRRYRTKGNVPMLQYSEQLEANQGGCLVGGRSILRVISEAWRFGVA